MLPNLESSGKVAVRLHVYPNNSATVQLLVRQHSRVPRHGS